MTETAKVCKENFIIMKHNGGKDKWASDISVQLKDKMSNCFSNCHQ
jgi:hypothetical protein